MSKHLEAALQQTPSLFDGLPLGIQLPIVVLTVNEERGDLVDARVVSRDVLTAILSTQKGGTSWDENGDSPSSSA